MDNLKTLSAELPALFDSLLSRSVEVLSPAVDPFATLLATMQTDEVVFYSGGEKIHKRTLADKAYLQTDELHIIVKRKAVQQHTSVSADPELETVAAVEPQQQPDPIGQLLEAFRNAAKGHRFVALKWFRDQWIPLQKFDWSADDALRRNYLRDAIDKGLLRKELLPNPNNPSYPTTTLKEGSSGLVGKSGAGSGSVYKFSPIDAPGKPLSQYVIEGRN